MNSMTKVAARWFPVNERATATGIATMAGYLGMIVAMILTPALAKSYGMGKMLMIYGYVAGACAVVFIVFSKERPPIPPGPGEDLINQFDLKDVKALLFNHDFKYLMISMFVVMGIFNAVMTWIEDMLVPKGVSADQAGLIGGIMIVVGLIGAVVLPSMSDKLRRRRPFLIWPIIATIPGFAGLTFFYDFKLLLVSAAVMGFFVMGMGPIAFQYGAEIAYPVPEGTSYGILMIMGQISGILFIYLMDALRSSITGDMTFSLAILIFLMIALLFLIVRLRESSLILAVQQASNLPDKHNVIDSSI